MHPRFKAPPTLPRLLIQFFSVMGRRSNSATTASQLVGKSHWVHTVFSLKNTLLENRTKILCPSVLLPPPSFPFPLLHSHGYPETVHPCSWLICLFSVLILPFPFFSRVCLVEEIGWSVLQNSQSLGFADCVPGVGFMFLLFAFPVKW